MLLPSRQSFSASFARRIATMGGGATGVFSMVRRVVYGFEKPLAVLAEDIGHLLVADCGARNVYTLAVVSEPRAVPLAALGAGALAPRLFRKRRSNERLPIPRGILAWAFEKNCTRDHFLAFDRETPIVAVPLCVLAAFNRKPPLSNVAGGNRGLARALAELQRAYRPVYITHELNRVTEPLLRTQQIDYLMVQDLDEMVRRTTQFIREIPSDDRGSHTLEPIPFRLLTQFNIG